MRGYEKNLTEDVLNGQDNLNLLVVHLEMDRLIAGDIVIIKET